MFSLGMALHYLQGSSPDHSAEQPWQEGVCFWPPESLGAASSPVSWRSQGRAHNPHSWDENPFWILSCFYQKWAFAGCVCWMQLSNGHSAALVRPDVCPTAASWKWDISTPVTNHVEKYPVLDRNPTEFRCLQVWVETVSRHCQELWIFRCLYSPDMANEAC